MLPSTLHNMIQGFRRRFALLENTLFDLDFWVTRNGAQNPLHFMTYAAVNLEVATSNSLGGDALQENQLFVL